MKILVCKNYDEMSKEAAKQLVSHIVINPNTVLGLATGSTPVGLYKELVRRYEENEVSFKDVTTFNLDEYIGISNDNEQSYHTFMNKNLFNHIDIKKENIHIPDGMVDDCEKHSREYDESIKKSGGIDVQILGIGNNAHIGFNEPSNVFSKGTGIVSLTESTINANSRFFESIDEVPKKAISMGIGSIFNAKKIILLASGKNKAEAIHKAVNGDIDPMVPASILQLHQNVLLILDEDAASLITK